MSPQIKSVVTTCSISQYAMESDFVGHAKEYAVHYLTDAANDMCQGMLGVPIKVQLQEKLSPQQGTMQITMRVDVWIP